MHRKPQVGPVGPAGKEEVLCGQSEYLSLQLENNMDTQMKMFYYRKSIPNIGLRKHW